MRVRRIDLTHEAYTYMRVFASEDNPAAPVLLVVPGYGTPAAALDKFAARVLQEGVQVVTFDLRGQGASRPRPNPFLNWGWKRHFQDDLPLIVADVHELFPEAPVYVFAHSLGGHLASLYVSQHPGEVDGLILLATGISHRRNHASPLTAALVSLGVVGMNLGAQLFRVYPAVFAKFDGGYGRQPRGMLWDSGLVILTGKFQPARIEFDAQEALSEIDIPVLGATLEADPYVPPKVLQDFLRLFTGAKPTQEHIQKRLGHAGWIGRPQLVVELVAQWVKAKEKEKADKE
ncbi:alpha/beta hydrolase fold protein [Segniliparus rotundus DSM 44985]|uniref:Alpha/beta hydrolase fold protein n=1 Tax=Segniliparus rotundus (strain ATCC BAA-972 / CDC 1076 / CIP 108378 / DSM 44985 / JCM 13578) TaxID=640132 RepID=D6ZBS4_SEGRD|nr:alpha/beta fold hydrolase [Segniliparus rotundus]ADG96901.1 alpha/beta hydrolase fold protein [Segniliparus rotundus DSM 44985]